MLGAIRLGIAFWAVSALSVVQASPIEYDLTAAGSVTVDVNGGLFTTPPPIAVVTGTGTWGPFVRIQSDPSGNQTGTVCAKKGDCEQGYNTSDTAFQYDEKAGTWTHDVLFSAVQQVTFNGVAYMEFGLDIAEPEGGVQNLLSLDQLQIFVGPHQTNSYSSGLGNGTLGSLTALYSLDVVGGLNRGHPQFDELDRQSGRSRAGRCGGWTPGARSHEGSGVIATTASSTRSQGDGVMALFGAPRPHEDHAVRGCLAALAMQDSVASASRSGHADPRRRPHRRGGGADDRTHLYQTYDAAGANVHIANRMEQTGG